MPTDNTLRPIAGGPTHPIRLQALANDWKLIEAVADAIADEDQEGGACNYYHSMAQAAIRAIRKHQAGE